MVPGADHGGSLEWTTSGSWARALRVPASAHAAFHKGAHYFGLETRKVDVDDDWRADVDAMADAIDDDTVLVRLGAERFAERLQRYLDVEAYLRERVEAIVGPLISEFALPAAHTAMEEAVPMVSPTASSAS